MASRTLPDFYRGEYSAFTGQLEKDWGISLASCSTLATVLKPLHKKYLGLACIATIMGKGGRRNEYVQGIPEACYSCIILALRGLENPSSVLLRQTIELTLKHIFFVSHPVEYRWAIESEDYKELTFQFLCEYLSKVSEFKALVRKGILAQLQSDFALLSRYVHVHSKEFLIYSVKCSSSRKVSPVVSKISTIASRLWPLLSLLLVAHSASKYVAASVLEKRIIRNVMPTRLRTCLDECVTEPGPK